MILKNCCSELGLIFQAVKNRIWFLCFTTVLFFFSQAVPLTLMLQRYHMLYEKKNLSFVSDVTSSLEQLLSYNVLTAMIMIGLAVLCGLIFFRYLHNKQKVDFYHCLPVSRGRFYLAQYFAGVATVILPYIFFYLISLLIIAMFGDFRYLTSAMIWSGLLRPIVYFLLVYSFTVLAAILTGNTLVQICTVVYLFFIFPLILLLVYLIMSSFYATFMMAGAIWDQLLFWSSPVIHYLMVAMEYQPEPWWAMVISFVVAVVFTGIGLLLYRIRPSETAGKAIAFPWFKPLIKYPLSIAGGICLGVFLNSMSYSTEILDAWFILGTIFGVILINRVVEVIFAFDIGALKTNWLGVIVSLVVTAAMIAVPALDLTEYDSYLPDENDVAKVVLQFPECSVYGDGMLTAYDSGGSMPVTNNFEEENQRFALDEEDEIAAAMELARSGIEHLEYYDHVEKDGDNILVTEDEIIPTDVSIAFVLKNGKTVYRHYTCVDKRETIDAVETIVTNESFRQQQLAYLDQEYMLISTVELYALETDTGSFSRENQEILLEAYRQDMNDLTFDMMKESPVIGLIQIAADYETLDQAGIGTGKTPIYVWEISAPIYDACERTKAVLEDLGFAVSTADSTVNSMEYYAFDEDAMEIDSATEISPNDFDTVLSSTVQSNELYVNYFCTGGDVETPYYEVSYYLVTWKDEDSGKLFTTTRQTGERWALDAAS